MLDKKKTYIITYNFAEFIQFPILYYIHIYIQYIFIYCNTIRKYRKKKKKYNLFIKYWYFFYFVKKLYTLFLILVKLF